MSGTREITTVSLKSFFIFLDPFSKLLLADQQEARVCLRRLRCKAQVLKVLEYLGPQYPASTVGQNMISSACREHVKLCSDQISNTMFGKNKVANRYSIDSFYDTRTSMKQK